MKFLIKKILSSLKSQQIILLVKIFTVLLFAQEACFSQGTSHSFVLDGNERNYLTFMPQNYVTNKNEDFPLVIFLHGNTETAQLFIDYTKMDVVADTSGFFLVVPNAINKVWNSGCGEKPEWPTPDVDDVAFIDALIYSLIKDYRIDIDRIYIAGFSGGGFMTLKLACQSSRNIAAIASVAGSISIGTSQNCHPTDPLPVLLIHGRDDHIVLFDGEAQYYKSAYETLNYWTNFNGCYKSVTEHLPDIDPTDKSTVTKYTYFNNSDDTEVVLYDVINGDHTWPGMLESWGWAKNMDINASVEILNFFKRHKRNTAVSIDKICSDKDFSIQIYQNPCYNTTTIKYSIPQSSFITIRIYNMLGKEVSVLVNDKKNSGIHEVEFNRNDLPDGIYFCRMSNGNFNETKKICLLKDY